MLSAVLNSPTAIKKNQEGHKVKRHVKSASLALIICAASVFAESAYEDVVKKEYHFAEWGGTTKAEYSHCLKRVPLESLVLPTNGMDIVVRHKEDRLLVFSKGKTLIDVRTSAHDSILAAHAVLIERFSLMASTRLMRSCQTIGDVCFVDTGEGWSSVVFARNNVEVDVSSRTSLISAMDIAAQIDRAVVLDSYATDATGTTLDRALPHADGEIRGPSPMCTNAIIVNADLARKLLDIERVMKVVRSPQGSSMNEVGGPKTIDEARRYLYKHVNMAYPPVACVEYDNVFFFSGGTSTRPVKDFSSGFAIKKNRRPIFGWEDNRCDEIGQLTEKAIEENHNNAMLNKAQTELSRMKEHYGAYVIEPTNALFQDDDKEASVNKFADSASPLHDGVGTNHVVALAKDDLLSFFDSVEAQGTNVCLKFKAQGARYLCIASGRGNGHKMLSYGETIILPEGGTLSLHERHSSLSFEPIKTACGARGFLVRKKMDLRSYGEKEVLEKKGCLLFVQSDGDGDEDDDSCAFKGVVLKAFLP